MKLLRTPSTRIAVAIALCASLGACVVAPARPYYAPEAVITVAPPAPRVEVIGVAPSPGYIWLGGYWGWQGGQHVWVSGHWSAPRPGYHWVAHTWVHEGGGWRMHEGHWERG